MNRLVLLFLLLAGGAAYGQQPTGDSLLQDASLPNVIRYAIKNQPRVQQALVDEKITDLQIKSRLADWYPQVNFNYIYQHNFQVQTNIIGGNPVRLGVANTSAFQFGATQTIFNRDVLLANRTRNEVRLQARQQSENTRIDIASDVSKAFYDVLATQQQIRVSDENIVRLERSLRDARAQYDAGVVDKTDYKRATIALNNARALRKSNEEALKAKTEYLKALMNYPETGELKIIYDSATLEQEIPVDTMQGVDYSRRIEYQLLETQRRLQEANVQYNRWSYLPSLSANGAYNLNYLNDQFSKLYNNSFPASYAGLTLAFPIFQGGKRKYNLEQSKWQLKRTDLEITNLKNSVNAEYASALAAYKSALVNYLAVRDNVELAQEVYDVINLQYRSGIKTYLEVITSETDLRTAQINYFNALYQVLSSKIDVQRTKGDLKY
ncbi:MAG: transporter [Sphingobacteriales bacterium SCN 48-20]|jgi:outer membrane protein|uniref:TolC family protein n=1 Tax=Terrimonas ferruginea TaxID=249 RepID=UPI00086F3B7C|nr:TolC family protein [Terrimonas ferruginea]MBN8782877.1 TolC family protein [Terrimonas ferruginea]ODT92761.1 MAG: transporter [Sphingobacteriales bacterium SCN 48-20]OJW44074.1 MAG: transporter [Sphingobacteriales bacterium 48-107]